MEYPRSLFAYKGIRRKRGYGVIECNRHNRKWSRLGMANDHSAAWLNSESDRCTGIIGTDGKRYEEIYS